MTTISRRFQVLVALATISTTVLGVVGLSTAEADETVTHDRPATTVSAPEPDDADEVASAAVAPAQRGSSAQTVSVVVPLVTFQAQARRDGTRIRTAVLVNIAAAPGTASLDGTSCRVQARPGTVAWLDCPSPGPGPVSVTVRLADGQVLRSASLPVVG